MNYNEELKNKKTWVVVIRPHMYDEKDNKPTRKMIKFNMPIPPPVINGRKMKNHASDARMVWDDLFAWKYGVRDSDINFMMNIQDLNRAIHVKVNFVSLIEKTPKQLKKEGLPVNTPVITADKKKMETIRQNEFKNKVINHTCDIRKNDISNLVSVNNSFIPKDDDDANGIIMEAVLDTISEKAINKPKGNSKEDVINHLNNFAKLNPELGIVVGEFKSAVNDSEIPKGDSITDDTKVIQKIFDSGIIPLPNSEVVSIIDSLVNELNEQDSEEFKRPRIKPGQRFMEDMVDKHLDPNVRKVLRVEERLTDDRFHMLRSKYVRMFDKKSLDKIADVDDVKNYWWCKTYLWRSNGKGVINMGYSIYSTEELYSFEKLTDERTIALKMEVMQWNKRISNEI